MIKGDTKSCDRENQIILNKKICFTILKLNEYVNLKKMEEICRSLNSTQADLVAGYSNIFSKLGTFVVYTLGLLNKFDSFENYLETRTIDSNYTF